MSTYNWFNNFKKAMVKFDVGNSLINGKEVFDCKLAYGALLNLMIF